MSKSNSAVFDNRHFVGYIKSVNAENCEVHIPSSNLLSLYHLNGSKNHPGIVGKYLIIEGEEFGFLAKVIEVNLPEKERLDLTEKAFEKEEFHPVAKVEILVCFDYFNPSKPNKGLDSYPHIGAKVFTAQKNTLQEFVEGFGKQDDDVTIPIGVLTSDYSTEVTASLQAIFGRHCAVVGTTGGGKSFTVSKLVEELKQSGGKMILFDATGEYHTLTDNSSDTTDIILGTNAYFYYKNLSIGDLFYLLRPSDKVQRPKLLEAIRSLKMARIIGGEQTVNNEISIDNGLLKKCKKKKRPIETYYYKNIKDIDEDNLNFDIKLLPRQLTEECIYDTDRSDNTIFGDRSETDVSFCTSLMSRINNLINSSDFQNIFGFNDSTVDDTKDIVKVIDAFLSDNSKKILRISLEDIGFEFQIREILLNSIGKLLLKKARNRIFKESPLILFVDEAHQFLNKTIQDDYASIQPLDAFESIAKECRKHGLFLCLSTQMPRDIPLGVLSQMGTFIVHRLINRFDKETVENACSTANRSILSFLPSLGKGEAILLGVDFPMPISLKINKPKNEPDSRTPKVIKK